MILQNFSFRDFVVIQILNNKIRLMRVRERNHSCDELTVKHSDIKVAEIGSHLFDPSFAKETFTQFFGFVLNLLLRPLFLCNRGGGGRRGKSFDTFNLAQFKLRKRDILMRSREAFGGASALALLNRNAQGFLPRYESLKKF